MAKILICEDEHIVALDIKRHLERFGYEVCGTWATGEDAVMACGLSEPDLVLMDIRLQGQLDGIEAARLIYEKYGTPVIHLTAYADEETLTLAKQSRPFGYIIKPFEERELRTAIEIALYRHGMEHQLRLSEERYRSLFNEAPSANFTAKPDGSINDCNEAFVRLLGVDSIAGLRGKRMSDLFASPSNGENILSRIREAHPRNAEEWDLQRRDGSIVTVLATVVFSAASGELRAYLIDITKRKELEAQLRQAQKMEAIGRLAGGVAHDFNNIITAIMGYCNLLAEDVGDMPALLEEVDGILSASRKAVNLTRQLLAFSRKQALEPKLIDINKSLSELEKMSRRLLNENVHIRFLLDSRFPYVNIDPGQFEQVLINLIVNAKDAMPRGGTLVVQTSDVGADGSGKEHGIPQGDWVLISVRDTGEGIAPENMQRIFEPFFSTKSAQQGTGLGLSTVYSILNQSGGHIVVESRLGEGSTFHVYLPLASGLPEDIEAPRAVTPGKRGGTILLVEDDDHLRMILYRMLDKAGYRVVEASNPKDALEIAGKEKDYLLLTDIGMPGMTGYELAGLLAARQQGLKVLFMSGYHNKKSAKENAAYAKSAFLQKPFTNEQLMAALASLD